MGLYKRCEHNGAKAMNSCEHEWWGQFQHDGENQRINLNKWSGGENLDGKQKADVVFERLVAAVRSGHYDKRGERRTTAKAAAGNKGTIAFGEFANIYITSYLEFEDVAAKETQRVHRMAAYFKDMLLSEIDTDVVRGYITAMRRPDVFGKHHTEKKTRKKSTLNRYKARLRHMFNWAIGEEYIEKSPFGFGEHVKIKLDSEDDLTRHRRLKIEEEVGLMREAVLHLQQLITIALDTGLRCGEMLSLTFADLEDREGWIRVRGETAKSGKKRHIPIMTERLAELLSTLRLGFDGNEKHASARVCSYGDSSAIKDFRSAFVSACERAGIEDLHWHDLRHEFASRCALELKPKPMPLPELQVILGHSNIKVTMKYVNVTDANIAESGAGLEAFALPASTRLAHSLAKPAHKLHVVRKRA
jgi:integrase